jgi:hypothetical protein
VYLHLPGEQARVDCRAMSDTEEEEDAPSTQVANAFSGFINIVGILSSVDAWRRYCLTTVAAKRKQEMLQELSIFVGSRPVLESPEVYGAKEMARRAMDAAPELMRLIEEWDGEGEPSALMTAWASGFMAGCAMSDASKHLEPRRA